MVGTVSASKVAAADIRKEQSGVSGILRLSRTYLLALMPSSYSHYRWAKDAGPSGLDHDIRLGRDHSPIDQSPFVSRPPSHTLSVTPGKEGRCTAFRVAMSSAWDFLLHVAYHSHWFRVSVFLLIYA